ncbi:MAG: AraC family transcriptional regulator [Gemmatimonadetes bacterium]|nr:AraC family transcriptional regulator [Gemmatimonadota bacterium]
MNRDALLHATPDLDVRRFDHPPGEAHEDPAVEVAERWSISFVRAGGFDVEIDGVVHALKPGSVLLMRPGLVFRCRHGAACPDDVCLSIGFSADVAEPRTPAWARSPWMARSEAPPRLAYVFSRLVGAEADADGFELERWALGALEALDARAHARGARGPYRVRQDELAAVEAACRDIERDPAARCSVAERARRVGMSSAALTHQFRRHVGLSPHQYVMRWRLALAAGFLDDGRSVSDSAYRAGFDNLSHFCRTFQRRFGVRPSRWTSLAPAERRRKVQDRLVRPL